jgi:hypothetical protein
MSLHMANTARRFRGSERAFTAALALLTAAAAWGGGAVFVPEGSGQVSVAGERAVVIDTGDGMETLIVSMAYLGPPGRLAWVIPVPGKPVPGGVGRASEAFVRRLFTATAPGILTEAPAPRSIPGFGPARRPRRAATQPPMARREVVVWQSMKAAPYEVAVIPATRIEALTDWLDHNGYRFDEDIEATIDEYVGRGWHFVAVKTAAPAGTGGLVQGELPALAIRFPRPPQQSLVYPLMFSKIGTRKWCVVEIILITPKEMDCQEVPGEPFEHGREWRDRGVFQILSDATSKGTKAVALWQNRSAPVGRDAWCVDGQARPARALPWRKLVCRRLWMRLRHDQLRDLHFGARERALLYFAIDFDRQPKEPFHLVREGGMVDAIKRAGVRALVDLGVQAWATAALIALVVALGLALGFAAVVYLRHFTVPPGAAVLAIAVALALLGARAHAVPAGGSGWAAWDQAAAAIGRQMRLFVDCFGVYPLRVKDLTYPHPQWGQDESGNPVDLAGAAKRLGDRWRPRAIKDLPLDPATGSQHTWLIDLGAPWGLRSKGLKTTVLMETPAAQPAR